MGRALPAGDDGERQEDEPRQEEDQHEEDEHGRGDAVVLRAQVLEALGEVEPDISEVVQAQDDEAAARDDMMS